MKKVKIKVFNFLYKIATDCKSWTEKTSVFSDNENVVVILIYKIYLKI